MRNHIQREASILGDATNWLVPTAFAIIAFVAVATRERDEALQAAAQASQQATVQVSHRTTAQPVLPVSVGPVDEAPAPALQPAPSTEVAQHIEAF